MTPMDHMSTGFPWPRLSITSGAAYPNEPAIVVRTSSLLSSILAMPKSARTRSELGALVRYSRFSGLRSARSEHGQPSRLPFSFGQNRGNMAATCKRAMLTSMDDVLGVEIVDGAEHLLDGLRGILLCELALLADPVEQLAARRQLGDDVVLVLQQSCLVSPAGRGAHIYIYITEVRQGRSGAQLTLDSNQSTKRTIWARCSFWSMSSSSYTMRSLPLTFFFRMILMATLPVGPSASRTMP